MFPEFEHRFDKFVAMKHFKVMLAKEIPQTGEAKTIGMRILKVSQWIIPISGSEAFYSWNLHVYQRMVTRYLSYAYQFLVQVQNMF